ncbi:NrfD/PsrC family molybdoenzyme membrane anchor subunit [Desulfosoma caldarium]|uniref:Molybdopterin-containing oxidoreductase family membrane subunit n=1 Tax=Desulfosoma caldarium TaxID=610254 RepID=A0A3N1UV69_9BACT|nr:NrfD/PsrC family molybdoenzyme membrane anchor subunit [Desulfosoma caldarium]ROQ91036.1 molybdopterin-containing oxidoreductase family membrane subunit [Desulfosoma caldarium]
MQRTRFSLFVGLAVLGLIVGSWGMVQRLIHGLNPVAFGSYVPWGLWVAFYLLFLGLSAGAFLVTILAYVFDMERFHRLGRLSAYTVLIVLVCEVIFITLDLGRMSRIYRFLVTPNFNSLMTWMFVLFNAMLIVYALKTFFLIRGDLVAWSKDPQRKGRGFYRLLALGKSSYGPDDYGRDYRIVHGLSLISLPVGLLFYGTNGAFFAILMNRPLWNSALTPLLFIVAAVLSGGALIAFLTHVFLKDDELVTSLGRAVLYCLLVFLFLEALQFFVGYQANVLSVVAALNLIAFGDYWWTFWIFHLGLGSFIPLLILLFQKDSPGAVAWACALIVLTFLAVRFNFVIPDLAVYKLEGLEHTFYHPRLRTHYTPNVNEWLVSVWVISLGLLIFLLGSRWLPVINSDQRGGMKHAH